MQLFIFFFYLFIFCFCFCFLFKESLQIKVFKCLKKLSQLTYQNFKTYVTKNNCIFITARIHEPTDIDYIIDQQNLVTISVGAYKTEYRKVSWMAVYYIQQAYDVVMMYMRCNDVASKLATSFVFYVPTGRTHKACLQK